MRFVRNRRIVVVCVFVTLFVCVFYAYLDRTEEVPYLQDGKSLFDTLRSISKRMEVFPVDIVADNIGGPLGVATQTHGSFVRWQKRYDLTFDRYAVFCEFKELAHRITEKDLRDCLMQIDEANPREKALILTTIFIFERTRRRMPHNYLHRTKPILPFCEVDSRITRWQWSRWIKIIEKYKKDETVVFPAIMADNEELIHQWEESYAKGYALQYDRWNLSSKEGVDPRIAEELFPTKDLSPPDVQRLNIFQEYLWTIAGDRVLSGIGPASGNSSAEPKTLGDIATQLLMSRLPYDGDEQ